MIQEKQEVVDYTCLPGEPTETECSVALFRALIRLHPFHDIVVHSGNRVLLSNQLGEMYGETSLKTLLESGAQA